MMLSEVYRRLDILVDCFALFILLSFSRLPSSASLARRRSGRTAAPNEYASQRGDHGQETE